MSYTKSLPESSIAVCIYTSLPAIHSCQLFTMYSRAALYPLQFIIFVESTQDKGSESVVTSRQKRCNSGGF